MEKYSQFRDRGSGISPFTPISTPSGSYFWLAVHACLFVLRLPVFIAYVSVYLLVLHQLPFPPALRKLLLWGTMGIPGMWWVDLQLDGVKRGTVSQKTDRLPRAPSVIAANFTSPFDALYLAAVFDPVFVLTFPGTRKVQQASLLRMFIHALSPAQLRSATDKPPASSSLINLPALLNKYPDRIIVVFPECGTTNGRGILPLGPSLADVPASTGIYPVSIRYTAPDITTPVPGAWGQFLWKLLSRPTHCIRVRIAEVQYNKGSDSGATGDNGVTGAPLPNGFAIAGAAAAASAPFGAGGDVTAAEQRMLDSVAEALARLGRGKRVGLTLDDKKAFVDLWKKSHRSWI